MNAATTTTEGATEAAMRANAARQRELRDELARCEREMTELTARLIAIRSEDDR